MNSLTDIVVEKVEIFSPELTPIIDKLAKQIGENYEGITHEELEHIVKSDTTYLLVAKDTTTGSIVGMITLVMYRIPYKTKGWIEDLVVDEEYRGLGIATLLVEKLIALAKEYDLKKLDFTSRPQRESANNLYTKLGFHKHETNVYRLTL